MTKDEYEEIGNSIYDNGRVIADENGNDTLIFCFSDYSYSNEFRFEAKRRGFSDEEIEIALNTYL